MPVICKDGHQFPNVAFNARLSSLTLGNTLRTLLHWQAEKSPGKLSCCCALWSVCLLLFLCISLLLPSHLHLVSPVSAVCQQLSCPCLLATPCSRCVGTCCQPSRLCSSFGAGHGEDDACCVDPSGTGMRGTCMSVLSKTQGQSRKGVG